MNIEENKTSVKVTNQPGGKSNWSLYWNEPEKNTNNKSSNIVKYHNESHFAFGDKTEEEKEKEEQEAKRREEEKKKQQINQQLPSYDPRNGGKSSLSFGDDKTDYRPKDQVFTSVKVKSPPGGKSSIQFG